MKRRRLHLQYSAGLKRQRLPGVRGKRGTTLRAGQGKRHTRLSSRSPRSIVTELRHREMTGRPRLHRKRVFNRVPKRRQVPLSALIVAGDTQGGMLSRADARDVFLGFSASGKWLGARVLRHSENASGV